MELVALSLGESEVYASLRASAEKLALMPMARNWGNTLRGHAVGDANAVLGGVHRKGLGATKHIDTGCLWVQQVAAQRRLSFAKIQGKKNPTELYTKHTDMSTMSKHVGKLNCWFTTGRSNMATELHNISMPWHDYSSQQDSHGVYKLED